MKAAKNALWNVSQTGGGTYSCIQDAINAACNSQLEQVEILIKPGIYKEVIHIPKSQTKIKLKGEAASRTVITYDNYAGMLNEAGRRLGTGNSATVFIDADDFSAEGITFENSYYRPGLDDAGRQAVAVNTAGERNVFTACCFKGYQDTLYTREGSCYFKQCYIEGDIDFIFGAAQAVFEDCELCSLYGGSSTDNGYVTAASTKADQPYGFLFENCRLTADSRMPAHTVYLGRPWHPSSETQPICVSTVFKNCELGAHIKKEGWTFMGQVQPETERLYEYKSTGEGAFINEQRRQLTSQEAEAYSKEKVLTWLSK